MIGLLVLVAPLLVWETGGTLRGEEIPLSGRILAVVDVFDALTCRRPYREPLPAREALAYLRQHAGSLFDPSLVSAFEDLYRRGSILVEKDSPAGPVESTPVRFHDGAISY